MQDGSKYNLEYQYDIMGQATGVRYPNSVDWLSYEYDKMERMITISGFAGTNKNPGFTCDENSALQSAKTDNGVQTIHPKKAFR